DVLEHLGSQHERILRRRRVDMFEIAEDADRPARILNGIHPDVLATAPFDQRTKRLLAAAGVKDGACGGGIEHRWQRRRNPAVDRAYFPAIAALDLAVRRTMR